MPEPSFHPPCSLSTTRVSEIKGPTILAFEMTLGGSAARGNAGMG